MFGTVYLLLHDKPIQRLTAVGSAFEPTSSNSKRKNEGNLRSRYRDRVARDNPPETWSKEHSQPTEFLRRFGPRILAEPPRAPRWQPMEGSTCFGGRVQRENSGQCRVCSNVLPLWTKEAYFFIMTLCKWRLLGNGVHHTCLLASYVLRLPVF